MSDQTLNQPQETSLVDKPESTAATESTSSLLSSLRLPDTYSASGGTVLPLKATYGKLNKYRFSRVHPGDDYKFPCLTVEDKDSGETYLASPNMAGQLGSLATVKTIRLAVDNAGTPKLIGEPDLDPNGRRNLWHSSLKNAIKLAEDEWVRVQANMSAGQYEITTSANDLGFPRWPKQSMEELINDAFAGRIIDSPDHPYIRQIQGRI
ncbi:hypothetical protein ICV01_06740 [Polynucleobacter sp. MWH-Spelu-300-X4]|jgi:hypothetical protein|uniref:hypothetical protein n=1 Tax=Polynucleobacter sp. MWH-Spelu-300-X4 TaxID=2689109 RepID=UPI001BFD25CA|nr:hypothetical protein [Polynucleobacter sp. MWH-Spelu-300-X4]QWD79338.1 hypothetical protein ICV01_06740 [Polynucleobacter sp. MWH-Spelu-300-X4]